MTFLAKAMRSRFRSPSTNSNQPSSSFTALIGLPADDHVRAFRADQAAQTLRYHRTCSSEVPSVQTTLALLVRCEVWQVYRHIPDRRQCRAWIRRRWLLQP